MFKDDIKKNNKVLKNTTEPFVRVSGMNKEIEGVYLSKFTALEQGYIYMLIRSMDSLGRLKHGENYQQYCKDYADLEKLLSVSTATVYRLVKKFKEHNIVRLVTITRGANQEDVYLSFNPALAVNGVYWDRWTVIVWEDIIQKHGLLSTNQIKQVVHLKGRKESVVVD